MSYGYNSNDRSEYGGGGSSNNYYDQSNDFSGRSENQGYGSQNQEYRDTRYEGREPYSGGDDFSSAAQHASHHDSGNSDLFSNALSFIQGRASSAANGDIDEKHAVKAHQAMYGSGEGGQTHDSGTVGTGAAMQALKMFTGGGSDDGGMDKNKLIGLAMAQAGKLWDEKEGSGANMSGDKQSAINNAAEMALKMYMKGGGGMGTGGPSGLMGLASKFLS